MIMEKTLVNRKTKGSVFVVCLLAAFVLMSVQVPGQETNGDRQQAQQLINDLRETVPYERGPVMGEIEALGSVAVQPLTQVVGEWKAQGDRGYVSCCMIILGRLGADARPASKALVEALQSSSAHIRFSAAKALGNIWAGQGGDDNPPTDLNGALAAALYSTVYEGGGAEVLAPAMALKKINGIPIDTGEKANVASLSAVNLRRQVGRWIARHPEAFPEFENQPWQLLLAYIMQRPRSEKAKKAKKLLIRNQPLSAIASITDVCLYPQIKVESPHWKELADILTGLTEVDMPRESDKSDSELVTDWRTRWLKSLRDRTSKKYREYALDKIDALITKARENPSRDILGRVDMMKGVLLQQLDSPDQLPGNLSPEARSMLETPLQIKAQFAKTLAALEKHTEGHRRLQDTKNLQRIASMESGRIVAKQFLDELVDVAQKEQRRQILGALGRLFRDSTGVPIVLRNLNQQQKKKRLNEWLEQVRTADDRVSKEN